MNHPFEFREHLNPLTGNLCHCPWGYYVDPEHLGSVKEASKLEWLEGRPDMADPRNRYFLDHVKRTGLNGESIAEADKVLPWLHREFKKGRLLPSTYIGNPHFKYKKSGEPWDEGGDMEPGEVAYSPEQVGRFIRGEELKPEQPNGKPWAFIGDHNDTIGNLNLGGASEIERALQDLSKRRQGIDIMQHKVHELMPKIDDWRADREAEKREGMGKVLHRFPDGWTVRQMQTMPEMEDEGNLMGHCMGQLGQPYLDQSERGERAYLSLRDHKNMPHATMEVTPHNWALQDETQPMIGPAAHINQFYGKEDLPPLPEYAQRMNDWLRRENGPQWEEYWGLDPRYLEEEGLHAMAAPIHRPLYFRWVYSPSKGVTVNSNQESHPALVRYHGELGSDINDTDLTHGYASAIGNGWRITDLAHKPVEDPYIVNQVVRALNLEDGPQIRSEGGWQPSEYDWERIHYGLPQELLA